MRAEQLFTPEAQEAVARAVAAAERDTSGEIVPMVVDRSDAYPGVRAAAAALLAFAAAIGVLGADVDPWLWLPPVQLAVFALGFAVFGWRAPLRWLIPPAVRAERVDRAAQLAFVSQGVVDTRERTGILIYVSLLEHRVEVLADRGIDAHVPDGTWDGVVERILRGIRERHAEQGLVEAIALCGAVLARSFPPRHDDENELPDRLRGRD